MKKIFLIIILSVSFSISAQTLPEYGYTLNGDFFIKESLVDKCGQAGDNVELQGLFNNKWLTGLNMRLIDKDRNPATQDDGYYVYQSGNHYKANSKVLFVIKINESTWFPDCDPTVPERISNNQEGWNLKMGPTDQISF